MCYQQAEKGLSGEAIGQMAGGAPNLMRPVPIGTVRSCFKVKFGTPRQGSIAGDTKAYIELDKKWELEKSLSKLDSLSHAWKIFWFHDNKNLVYRPVVRPPRLNKRVGVLASRTLKGNINAKFPFLPFMAGFIASIP